MTAISMRLPRVRSCILQTLRTFYSMNFYQLLLIPFQNRKILSPVPARGHITVKKGHYRVPYLLPLLPRLLLPRPRLLLPLRLLPRKPMTITMTPKLIGDYPYVITLQCHYCHRYASGVLYCIAFGLFGHGSYKLCYVFR